MSLKLIKQVSAYKMVLPDADAMEGHLATVPHEELTPSAAHGSGFVKLDTHGEYVVRFLGGYAFALRYDEKVVPGSVVKDELKKAAVQFEEVEGYKPGRKMLRELREIVVAQLCAKALVRSKTVICYYNVVEQLLIVPTIARKLKDNITAQLVRAGESIKSTTINVSTAKASLTTRLTDFMVSTNVDAFENFEVGNRVILVGPFGKSSFDLENLTDASHGIEEAIGSGGQVSEIELRFKGTTFRLTQDFLLKGIQFDEQEDTEEDDPAALFEHEAGVQVLLVSAIIEELCRMFDYTPSVDEADDLI